MKQRYTTAIKSDCFEKQKVRNREQGNIFFIYEHIITKMITMRNREQGNFFFIYEHIITKMITIKLSEGENT